MAQNNQPGTHVVTDGAVGSRVFVGNTAPTYPTVGDLWIDNTAGSAPSNNLVSYTATGGETSVTANYTVGTESVFLNGVKLVRSQDYTATNGTSITGLTALVSGDVVEVQSFVSNVVSGTVALNTVTTAGDLIIGTGASTVSRLGIGSSGTVLVSNGTTASWSSVDQDAFAFSLMTIGA
jgi:hypothetical protein